MHILIGYDGTNAAKAALKVGKKLALGLDGEVMLITSLRSAIDTTPEKIEEVRSELNDAKSIFEKAGIVCQTNLLMRGLDPGEDLVTYAAENRCEHIIIGTKRRSKIGKLILGSTAQYIILNAHCPVTSVK
ncbi:MAG: universal stress protein [Desulfobacterales bacterium]|nr:universal stress protein [Desulfobacterales bacterium]